MSKTVTQVLKIRLETENFNAGRTAFQNLATDAKAAGGPLTNLTTQLQQVDKSTTSVGAKLKNFGKTFSTSIASLGAFGGSVLNLSRQYQDLGDSQIRVDRVTLKLNRSQEALTKAQDKLAGLNAKGIKSGKEYEQALLDVQQAQDAVKIQTDLLREAQEDQQRAQEDFWIGLVPTVTTAGASIMSVISDLKGTKGLGGLTSVISGLTGTKGLGGLGKSITDTGVMVGSGSTGLVGKIGGLKTAFIGLGGAITGAAAAFLLIDIISQVQAVADKYTGVQELGGRTPPLLIPLIGDEKSRKQAIANYESDIIMAQEIVKRGGTSPTGFDYLQDFFTGSKIVEGKMKEVGLTVGQVQGKIKGLAAEGKGAQAVYNPLTIAVDKTTKSMDSQGKTVVTLTSRLGEHGTTVAAVTPEDEKFAAALEKMRSEAKFLDADFQPIIGSAAQLADVMATANANLAKQPQYIDPYVAAIKEGVAAADAWIAAEKTKIAQDSEMQRTLLARAKALGNVNLTEKSSVKTIQLWIDYTIAASQGNTKLAASYFELYKKANQAEQGIKGAAAAQVQFGALLPADKKYGIPEGGRSGKLRVRSDYQQPLIGSPFAQRQMLAGSRPPDYGRGSTEIKKLAADIDKAGSTYAQGVGKMTAANTQLKTSLGNMPASLLPVKQGIAAIPAATKPAVVGVNEMARALKNVPKVTAPKVTATTNKPAVDAMARSIANIKSKTVHINAIVDQRYRNLNAPPSSRFYRGQHGMERVTRGPTLFMAGEGGRRERVSVHPIGSASDRGGRSGGNEGFIGKVQLIIGDGSFEAWVRRVANSGQGTFR